MRVAEFDRRAVLRSAMNAFITKGYHKTSMQDLKKVTGLHPGSIYCAFENKRGLLLAALEHYRVEGQEAFDACFAEECTILSGLYRYFEQMIDECERDEIKDCLLQKSLSEVLPQEPEVEQLICNMIHSWQENIYQKLMLAQERGEIDRARNCQHIAEFLVMGIFGMRTYAHTSPEAGAIRRLGKQLLDSAFSSTF